MFYRYLFFPSDQVQKTNKQKLRQNYMEEHVTTTELHVSYLYKKQKHSKAYTGTLK